MYKLRVSYGRDIDDPEDDEATVEILGPYRTQDEAYKAAETKYDAIKDCIVHSGAHICDTWTCPATYYVSYGYVDIVLGYVDPEHYYHISVIE